MGHPGGTTERRAAVERDALGRLVGQVLGSMAAKTGGGTGRMPTIPPWGAMTRVPSAPAGYIPPVMPPPRPGAFFPDFTGLRFVQDLGPVYGSPGEAAALFEQFVPVPESLVERGIPQGSYGQRPYAPPRPPQPTVRRAGMRGIRQGRDANGP